MNEPAESTHAKSVAAQRVSTAAGDSKTVAAQRDSLDPEWSTTADDPAWSGAAWLDPLRSVPIDGQWPRLMSAPHPRAVATLAPEFVEWCREERGVELRWWQELAATRILEVDEAGEFVWLVVLLSTARQVGKSVLLCMLASWRITQADRFGEEQLVVHTGKDLPVCREVQRPSRAWARQHRDDGWNALDANGKEEVSAPDGSRWIVRGKDSVYGYSASMPLVDEAWDVASSVVDEGLEPTMIERRFPQLLIASTAHRRATSLFPSRRAGAIDQLREPEDVLLVEWSAHEECELEDEDGWRAASPHWSPRRESMLRSKLARALAGEGDAEDVDDDPVESFRGQYLNIWTPPTARLIGRDEPLVGAEVWDGCADVHVAPSSGPLVVALEDYFGLGAAVGVAAWAEDGERVLVWGGTFPGRSAALSWAERMVEERPGSAGLCGASLLAWAQAAQSPESRLVLDGVGLSQTRAALAGMRDLIAGRRLVHDAGWALTNQATSALVVPGTAGLAISPRSPRSDLLRAVAWAAQRLVDSGAVAPFRVM